MVIAVTLITPATTWVQTPRNWILVACDVGQGDALLARHPERPQHVMLIDTGDDPELLARCLDRFSIDRISLLVLTHDDRDHVGALPHIIDRVDEALIAPTLQGEHPTSRHVIRALDEARVPFRVGSAGMGGVLGVRDPAGASPSFRDERATWQVLAPRHGARIAESNAASLVLLLSWGRFDALMLADTGHDEQARLQERVSLRGIEVVKVAHHGSRDQDHTLYSALGARWGLVSAGIENRYGHPHPDTLGALLRAGTQPLRTDESGSIALIPQQDGRLVPWAERAADTAG